MADFRRRLTRAQQRQYDQSNAVRPVSVHVSARLHRAVELLEHALARADRPRTQRVAQVICDELCATLRVPPLRVVVKGTRPSKGWGELHGLYVPAEKTQHDQIEVWMVTAKRGQVVAFKTFLRTLLHEVCHHLDYTLFKLEETFHTDGFFRRESSLVNQLLVPDAPRGRGAATPGQTGSPSPPA